MTIERNASIQLRGDGDLLHDDGRWASWCRSVGLSHARENALLTRGSCLDSLLFALLDSPF